MLGIEQNPDNQPHKAAAHIHTSHMRASHMWYCSPTKPHPLPVSHGT